MLIEAHRKEHVGHVLFHSLQVRDSFNRFVDAGAFTGKNCLVNPKATRRYRKYSAICWDFVSHRNGDDVSGYKFGSMYSTNLT